MKIKMFFAALAFFPAALNAAVDADTIFLWDNDRGISNQMFPAIGVFEFYENNWSAIAVQDSRYGDFDIYLRYVRPDSVLGVTYDPLSKDDQNELQQTKPDIECNPKSRYVAVWEESLYVRGKEKPTAIIARRFEMDPIMVYYNSDLTSKNPSVACHPEGLFAVSFTRDFKPPEKIPAISCVVFDDQCNVIKELDVRPRDSLWSRPPVSRTAFCDLGFVVVYEDSSRDGTERSIYLSYYDRYGQEIKRHVKISNIDNDKANEEFPAVSVDLNGFGVVVWEDYRDTGTAPDIYYRTFQMKGQDGIELYDEKPLDDAELPETRPRVTMLNNKDFFVVYVEKRSGSDNDILGRAFIGGVLKPRMTICGDAFDQLNPDIDARKACDTFGIVWHGMEVEGSRVPGTFYDVRCRFYWNNKETIYPCDSPIDFVPDTSGGRRGWYFDDENYDDPATAWNEDPINEPDSVYMDLDLAILDQIAELNTNNQYRVSTADTLPYRKPGKELDDYEAIFMDLGYRTPVSSAGTMTQEERDALYDYYRGNNPTMIEGNDFGYYYDTTQLFKAYGTSYMSDGQSYLDGNIDTLYGGDGTSFKSFELPFDYRSCADNYVDEIEPNNSDYELIMYNDVPDKDRWFAGRCVGWGTYWKDGLKRADKKDSFTVYSSFMLSSIRSGSHPNTYAEIYRRLLGFLGLTCQPEPITAIICSTYASEGSIMLKWQVVSDNTPTESAEGPYKLKMSKTKMTSESAFNSAPEYYQTWNTEDSAVGDWRRQIVYGLPPMETLVVALKVSDEDTLWDALGAEPQVIVGGDSVTPHYIYMGASYGYFKDFSNKYEYINRRRKSDAGTDYDSLFVTWYSSSYFFAGFSRCDFRTEGDLFLYVDTRSGMGADSTVDYNGTGSATKSSFVSSFRPDYCLIIENELSTGRIYYKWVQAKDDRAGSWVTVGSTAYHVEDGPINNYLYTEIRIPFDTIAYTPGNEFKLMVLMQSEATNQIINAYPIFNPLGTHVYLTQYYTWGSGGLQSGIVPARRGIIGIEEETGVDQPGDILRLTAMPNPFSTRIKIVLPAISNDGAADASLRIYDVTGRLVKKFLLPTAYSILPAAFYWEGTDDAGLALPGGIYFCEYEIAEKKEAIKIIYIK